MFVRFETGAHHIARADLRHGLNLRSAGLSGINHSAQLSVWLWRQGVLQPRLASSSLCSRGWLEFLILLLLTSKGCDYRCVTATMLSLCVVWREGDQTQGLVFVRQVLYHWALSKVKMSLSNSWLVCMVFDFQYFCFSLSDLLNSIVVFEFTVCGLCDFNLHGLCLLPRVRSALVNVWCGCEKKARCWRVFHKYPKWFQLLASLCWLLVLILEV